MKKSILILLAVIIVFALTIPLSGVAFAESPKDNHIRESAKSAYLVDYSTGEVLFERNADEQLPIASMVKIMTLLITFNKIDEGVIGFDTVVTVSDNAAGMGGSQMFLDAGEDYTVSDLIKGITVCSANDASVAIAETISGSVDAFIELMNTTASSLGMQNTVFVNVTGLPADGQHSTARDVSVMMRKLLTHPEYFNYSTIYMEEYKHADGRVTELVNTNKLIRFYKGCDAGKTGFTNAAMFCLSASAKRDDMRVIATVIGAPDSKSRFAEISSMFNYAFANYKTVKIIDGSEVFGEEIEVKKGVCEYVSVTPSNDICVLLKKGADADNYTVEVDVYPDVTAPVMKGDALGKVSVISADGTLIGEAELLAANDIPVLDYKESLRRTLQNWFIFG